MRITNHSSSSSLTTVNDTTGSNQIVKGPWSATRMGPRPTNTLVLVHIDGAEEGDTASTLGSTPQYSALKYSPLRFV